jgi:predicted extracellular nuclease
VLDGFFVQEQDADADGDPRTSEGLFVFCRSTCPARSRPATWCRSPAPPPSSPA